MRGHWIRLATIMLALVLIAIGCVPPQSPFPTGTFTGPGSWTSEYKADGTYISRSSDAIERGTYTVSGDQIMLKGNYCGEIEGTYTWAFDGEALSFTAVDDPCVDRRGVMKAGSWRKQP